MNSVRHWIRTAAAIAAVWSTAAVTAHEDASDGSQNAEKTARQQALFEQETTPALLEKLGGGLRRAYYAQDDWAAAEAVDRKLYAAFPDEKHQLRLAETLLAAGKNREAAELFADREYPAEARMPRLFAAWAYARLGETEPAQAYLAPVEFDACTPQELMVLARASACLGDADTVSAVVAKILANAPAKETETLRAWFREADFEAVLEQEVFQQALATESQVGDHGCAGCPNRGTARCGGDCD